jgi:hypothetical protein
VETLGLPDGARRVVLGLPGSLASAYSTLCEWGIENWKGKRVSMKRSQAARDARWRASAMEFSAWTQLLRGLVASYGKHAVKKKLLSVLDRARVGFQPFAMVLLEADALPSDLDRRYNGFRPPGHPVVTTQFTTWPSLPPLEAAQWRQPVDSHPQEIQ